MSSLATPIMSAALMATLQAVQETMLAQPQIPVHTDHFIHAGVYVRTITLAGGVRLMGAYIKVPTVLIVSGQTRVFTGENWIELDGYNIIPALAGRKQIFETISETNITMIFHTDATTVEQAEEEFTDEFQLLMSRGEV